jgi:class 3 adenylate cyclase
MAATRSPPGGLRSPPAGAGRRATDEPVEHTVTRTTVNLAPCLQDAVPPAGCSVLSAAPARCCDLTKWAVEERLPLVVKGRTGPSRLAVFRPAGIGRCRHLYELS